MKAGHGAIACSVSSADNCLYLTYTKSYDVSTPANYDSDIVSLLHSPIGSEFARTEPEGPLTAL